MSVSGVVEMTEKIGKKGRKPDDIKELTKEELKAKFGPSTSSKLYELHAQKLTELARAEQLEGGSAHAFALHFGELLDNLLVAATARRLKRLQDEASS